MRNNRMNRSLKVLLPRLLLIVALVSYAPLLQAQQGTVIIRDGTTNTQESVKPAGTVTPNVLGVQGNANGVPIPVTISGSASTECPSTVPCYVNISGFSATSAVPTMDTDGTAITIYAGTLSTMAANLTTTTGNVITANTITINSLRCHNETSSAVTVNRTDTAGLAFETSFSIPANSNYYLESPGSMTKMVGLKLWAGTANALNCVMSARQ